MKYRIIFAFLFCLLSGNVLFISALNSTELFPTLIPSYKAKNVIMVRNDTIFLVRGTTYAYTVDTPVDEGLVRTDLKVESIKQQLEITGGSSFDCRVNDKYRNRKTKGYIVSGDLLEIEIGNQKKNYLFEVIEGALNPSLTIQRNNMTLDTPGDIILNFIAEQRSPKSMVQFFIPKGIEVNLDNTTVNIIGRGEVTLRNLSHQSIGKTGTNYSYSKVGEVAITPNKEDGQIITFMGLDLRPFNGIDLQLRINQVIPTEKEYIFEAIYETTEPKAYRSYITPASRATLYTSSTITDFHREMPIVFTLKENEELYMHPLLKWSAPQAASKLLLMASVDDGKSWQELKRLKPNNDSFTPTNLMPNTFYKFKLIVEGGKNTGDSNIISYYTGKYDAIQLGAKGDGITDDTEMINNAIRTIHNIGGGVLSFTTGDFPVRTIHLKSNVWLHIGEKAVIRCLPGNDVPETTWFSDRAYRSGLSPTDPSPYDDPENYLTKQDVGHTFFHNTMFFAERERNIKIFGNGRITGNGNLVTGDRVMNNDPHKRADKMFTFKLCSQIEIGGYNIGKDMWYDLEVDEPYYMEKGKKKNFDLKNVLHIDQGGHFVLLATGTDTIHVHDTYFGKYKLGNARDIYDFMACNYVAATNIYSKMSSDDIVKLGSDCSLGYTRPVKGYMIRNIIGDTNCNLFQIGSETADDIQDVYVDNIYVLGSNKAGFSISTNDGANIKNIFLNTGHTGKIHSRSKMYRTRAPFFISISNRGRVIGADVKRFRFKENGTIRDELLCTNSNIGSVENIIINDVDIYEVYGGSSFNGVRWKSYDGSQNKATPIIAGYKLPDSKDVEGGLNFTLPNKKHTGYINHIQFNRVNLLVKGGHPVEDANSNPPEIGVGRYNVGDLKIQPAYGFWFRHAKDVTIRDCSIKLEQPDGRHAIVFDDVHGAKIESLSYPKSDTEPTIKEIESDKVLIK